MIILHIKSKQDVHKIDKLIKSGHDVFILIYMEGCGPCNATRPEWSKLENALKSQYANNKKLVVIDVNKDNLNEIKHIGQVDGFPTMKYIGNYGKVVESYENSSIKKKDRSVDSFINWIESKITNVVSTTSHSSAKKVYERITKKSHKKHKNGHKGTHRNTHTKINKHRGGKWSRKYKLSIDCEHPKGFSQRQYCEYGRDKE